MKQVRSVWIISIGLICTGMAYGLDVASILALAEKKERISLADVPVVAKLPMPQSMRAFVGKLVIPLPKVTTQGDAKVISGTHTIQGMIVQVKLYITGNQVSVLVGLPAGVTFSKIDPSFAGLDTLEVIKAALVYTASSIKDSEWGETFDPGINLIARVKVAGQVKSLTDMVNRSLVEVVLKGVLNYKNNLIGSSLKMGLSGSLALGKQGAVGVASQLSLLLQFKQAAVGVAVPEVVFALQSGFLVSLPGQKERIAFTGEIQVSAQRLMINAWMDGYWDNAFGIKGLGIGDLLWSVTSNYSSAAATLGILTISGFCLGGGLRIGSKQVALKGCVELAVSPEVLLVGSLQGGLYLEDIAEFGLEVAQRAAKIFNKKSNLSRELLGKIPHIGFKNVELYIVSKQMFVSGVSYEAGIRFDLIADILGTEAGLKIRVDDTGFEGSGYVKPFKVGPLTVTGAGFDKIKGTDDDAAVVSIAFDAKRLLAQLYIDADIELELKKMGTIRAAGTVDLSTKGLMLQLSLKIFDVFDSMLRVRANGSVSPSARAQAVADAQKIINDAKEPVQDIEKAKAFLAADAKGGLLGNSNWALYLEINQSGLTKLGAIIQDSARKMIEVAKRDLNKAKDKVRQLDTQINGLKAQLKASQDKIAQYQIANKRNVEKASAQLDKAKAKLSSLESLKAELDQQVALCKGKAPQAAEDLQEFVEGYDVTKTDLEAALATYIKENPDITQDVIEAIKQKIAATATI